MAVENQQGLSSGLYKVAWGYVASIAVAILSSLVIANSGIYSLASNIKIMMVLTLIASAIPVWGFFQASNSTGFYQLDKPFKNVAVCMTVNWSISCIFVLIVLAGGIRSDGFIGFLSLAQVIASLVAFIMLLVLINRLRHRTDMAGMNLAFKSTITMIIITIVCVIVILWMAAMIASVPYPEYHFSYSSYGYASSSAGSYYAALDAYFDRIKTYETVSGIAGVVLIVNLLVWVILWLVAWFKAAAYVENFDLEVFDENGQVCTDYDESYEVNVPAYTPSYNNYDYMRDEGDEKLMGYIHNPVGMNTEAIEAAARILYRRHSSLLFGELRALSRERLQEIVDTPAQYYEGYRLAAQDILRESANNNGDDNTAYTH